MNERLRGALSLCRKAGKLVMGMDPAAQAAREGRAALLLTASDLSPRSAQKISQVGEQTGVPRIGLPCSMEELEQCAGRHCGIYAVCDKGFAGLLRSILC